MKIAFIGLGIMGSRMAKNLLSKGFNLTVYNRTRSAAEALKAYGAKVADTPNEAVKEAEIVITMLSTPEVVQEMAFGENGFVNDMKKGALWSDCSTVNPSFSRACGEKATDSGIHFIDSPVAGSKNQAEQAILVIFAGGNKEQVQKAQPLYDAMGKKNIHVGATGMGASLKILVNSMLAQSMLMFSENVLLGEQLGISKDFLLEFLPKLAVSAPFLQYKTDNIKNDQYDVEFPLEWMQKDLQLAAQTAYEVDLPLPLTNTAKERFMDAKRKGLGREDFSAIYKSINV